MTKTSAKIHKWLALLLTIPILFWFISGLFFAVAPIERVRSEHMKAATPQVAIGMRAAAAGLNRVASLHADFGEKIEIRSLSGSPVALVSGAETRPRLYDLVTGRRLSPIPAAMAVQIAEQDHAGPQRALRVERVTQKSTEYKGALPAWRVDFDDGANRSLYVSEDTGAVAARRSTLWRVFDFLWAFHILDFKEHEDFNTPLLIVASALALIVVVTGIIMLPSRLGFGKWKRRRRRVREG